MEKIKKTWSKLKENIKDFNLKEKFSLKEGGKVRPYFENILKYSAVLAIPIILLYFYSNGVDSSYLGKSSSSFKSEKNRPQEEKDELSDVHFEKSDSVVKIRESADKTFARKSVPIKLTAKQVIIREGGNLGYGFTPGTNLIGELLGPIDTREPNQVVRVLLPFGGKSKDGNSELPKGTLLMGQASYSGKGEKVSIQFNQAILPEGKPVKLSAIALDPKDYSTGLRGEIQSEAKTRALSVMGLSIASAMGEVLMEKEALGQGYQVTAKSNMKNAMLAGFSRAAETEVSNLQQESQTPDYVQIEEGQVVIISLTQGLVL